jgi:dolichol-phosphate mannosyltransferase
MEKIVIIPTYNEKENIVELVKVIRKEVPDILHILVVDSASPDSTADAVKELQKTEPDVYLISQHAKLGLGKAYLEGMQWALERGYDVVITMDADFSHHPRYLNSLICEVKNYDLVIGSRYVKNGELRDWPLRRRLISRFANWYARTLTGLPFFDLTSGFHCFRASLLKKVLAHPIRTEGYAFLVELKFLSILEGAKFKEIPIIFTDRLRGTSKLSKKVVYESAGFVLKLSAHRNQIRNIFKNNHTLLAK